MCVIIYTDSSEVTTSSFHWGVSTFCVLVDEQTARQEKYSSGSKVQRVKCSNCIFSGLYFCSYEGGHSIEHVIPLSLFKKNKRKKNPASFYFPYPFHVWCKTEKVTWDTSLTFKKYKNHLIISFHLLLMHHLNPNPVAWICKTFTLCTAVKNKSRFLSFVHRQE